MKKKLISIACLSVIYSTLGFANICDKIYGHWSGEWIDDKHNVDQSSVQINQMSDKHFYGTYTLSTGYRADFNGICKQLALNEAFLTLEETAPTYNPCRGLLMQNNNELLIHFYCFNPNNSGYFTRVGD